MSIKKILGCLIVIGFVAFIVPSDLLAQNVSDEFAGNAFKEQSKKIENFLFGYPMIIAALLGGSYAIFQAFMGSFKPLMVFMGIGLCIAVIPKFINSIFSVSGMLLP